MMPDSMTTNASVWASLGETRDLLADPLERAAKRLLDVKKPSRYTRTGQWPTLVEVDGHRCRFKVSNNVDDGDDFTVVYTCEELLASHSVVTKS
jgi:hypothetical protein